MAAGYCIGLLWVLKFPAFYYGTDGTWLGPVVWNICGFWAGTFALFYCCGGCCMIVFGDTGAICVALALGVVDCPPIPLISNVNAGLGFTTVLCLPIPAVEAAAELPGLCAGAWFMAVLSAIVYDEGAATMLCDPGPVWAKLSCDAGLPSSGCLACSFGIY